MNFALRIPAIEQRPASALPVVSATRYRFRDLGRPWRTVDESGIRSGLLEAVSGDVEILDFDMAIEFAQRFREEADLAAARKDRRADEQWSLWAEELEIYAARRRPAPGIVRRTAVHACDQQPTFAEMTRR